MSATAEAARYALLVTVGTLPPVLRERLGLDRSLGRNAPCAASSGRCGCS
ncbi:MULTISPECIES: hypothetical protein [Streptomyces]|uniref:Uncharacterized protein n=1 Tax=Streptomyces mutomycini TaxID=284036 RepID=A0ABW0BAF0_9ACTN|nr:MULTISPECIES: hypothetical protein [Streptomyces]